MSEMRELEAQILEKNHVLNALAKNEQANRDAIRNVKRELESLLYKYLKKLPAASPL
ncbi:MAG TPA: hypothetical protein GXX49_04380 [Clostridiaceae bacterium]|jgi:hypothetical protein|nr:hypothetical protein [Clostridiaceae bacterium]